MPTPSLRPLRPDQFDYWKAQHLLNRAGFGGTPGQVRALANLGLEQAVEHVVDYQRATDPLPDAATFEPDIMRPPTQAEQEQARMARRSGDEAALERVRRERQDRQRRDRQQLAQMQAWWMRRLIETPRPLEEKMTLFWHGHLATGYRAIEDSYHMYLQNQLFRELATGSFRDMIHRIVRDPAMLEYLNNDQNRRQAPNENLARELMELFTLGEGNDYTEDDIKEGARALTGYGFQDDEFAFRPRLHDGGPKRILGREGRFDGDDFVDLIFTRRAASEFLCWKLYRYFVNDLPGTPSPEARQFIVNLAGELRDREFKLKPLLTALFSSEHFYDPANTACLIKGPVQLVVQAVRSLRTPARELRALVSAADLMGQSLFNPPSVKGWDGGRAWINTSTLFVRQNVLVYLLTGQRPAAYAWERDGSTYDAMHMIEHLADEEGRYDPRPVVTYLLRFNLGREPHPERVQALLDFVAGHGGRIDNRTVIGLLALITAMPEYQLC
jgi:uncharacterized protein (DUF1800 family)